MPTYNIKNVVTGEVTTEVMTIAAMEEKVKDPTKFEVVIGTPRLVSGVNLKPDAGFREVLKHIERNNPGSNINTFS